MIATAWRTAKEHVTPVPAGRHRRPLAAPVVAGMLLVSFVAGTGAASAAAKPSALPRITKTTLSERVLPISGGPVTLSIKVRNATSCWFKGMAGIKVPAAHQSCAHGTARITAEVNPSDSLQKTHLHIQIWAANNAGLKASAYAYITEQAVPPLVLGTQDLAGAEIGTLYSEQLAATGGRAPYSWRLTAGNLPAGFVLSAKGVLSGTPTAVGTYPLTVEVTDSSSPNSFTDTTKLTLYVTAEALSITTSTLPSGPAGTIYSATLAATGGTAPYSWKLISGTLPSGLVLSAAGVLSGTPTTGGTFTFGIQVTDSAPSPQLATSQFSIVISSTTLSITTSALSEATVGTSFTATLAATGGLTPYTWSYSSGTLPSGVTLSSAGVLSGTATVAGTYSFTVKVADSSSPEQTATASYSLVVLPVPLTITTSTLSSSTVGSPYSATLAVTGGVSPYHWAMTSGTLPAGITLSTGGVLSGTPTKAGTYPIDVTVTDSSPTAMTATADLSLTVNPLALAIATTALPAAAVSSPYAATLAASGGTAPYTWSVASGTLPTGITLSAAGNLSGITTTAGTYSFTVKASDSSATAQTATALLTMVVGSSATNWSGYILTGTYTLVEGTFTVPSTVGLAQGQTNPAATSEWVGLDGVTSTSLIQAGVDEVYNGGTVTITPWYDIAPAAKTDIVLTVHAGDSITVSIWQVSGTTWAITLSDNTSGQHFSVTETYSGPGTTADYVVQAPPNLTDPLASYSPAVLFSGLQTTGTTSSTAAVILIQNGVQVSTPSVYTSTGFAVAYGSIAPAP